MAVLLCLVQTASAVAAKSPEKIASGIFFADPNIYTGEIAPESLQPQWEIALAATPTASGRQVWLSADPIGEAGGINLYGYVGGNPVFYRDELGLFIKPDKRSSEYLEQLRTLSDYFEKMISALEKSKNTHTISCNYPANDPDGIKGITNSQAGNLKELGNEKNGVGVSTDIRYITKNFRYSDGTLKTPADVLAHELQHAWDLDRGIINREPNSKTGTKCSEERAVRTQNVARKALNLTLLKTYGDPKHNQKVENYDIPLAE